LGGKSANSRPWRPGCSTAAKWLLGNRFLTGQLRQLSAKPIFIMCNQFS
jgi:hypothetical protein